MQQRYDLSLKEMALTDPVRAYMLLRGYTGRPVSLSTTLTFSSFALNQNPIVEPLDNQNERRTWIDNVTYSISLPNAQVGNIFYPQSVNEMKASTGISTKFEIMAGPRYVMNSSFMPLENWVNQAASRWQAGWQLFKNQQIKTTATLTAIPYNDASTTPPMVVTISFNGWQFDDMQCDDMSCEDAQEGLVQIGYLVPKEVGGKKFFCPSFKD